MNTAKQNGFILITTVLILTTLLVAGTYLITISNLEYKITKSQLAVTKNYYLAEAGANEMIWKIKNDSATSQAFFNGTLGSSYDITRTNVFGDSDANYQVTAISLDSASAQIIATSTYQLTDGESQRVVKVDVNTGVGVNFSYGVQVGEGGVSMRNSSQIVGNIFSNGSIVGDNSVSITGDAWAAATSTISGFTVGVDAHSNTIEDSTINGDAYYQTISGTTVTGSSFPGSPNPDTQPLPITQSQIDGWKADALLGGEIGDYTIDGEIVSLGPIKITGNLIIKKDSIVTLTGTIWVTGDVTLQNNAVLELDPGFSGLSGVLVADGKINILNSFIVCGSEGYDEDNTNCFPPTETYILFLTTNTSVDVGSPAIIKENLSTLRGILYAGDGMIAIENHAALLEATGYALDIRNQAVVTYEGGLGSMHFSSGPSGGWEIENWREEY